MGLFTKELKFSLFIASVLALTFGCATSSESTVTDKQSPQVYEIGDIGPAGGIVFFTDRKNDFPWTYLEAAPAGWHNGDEDPIATWGPMGVRVEATGYDTGSGADNTAIIAEADGDYAAHLASMAIINGFDDWFLPSNDTLYTMYENLFRKSLGGLSRESYWSSTERTQDRAMVTNFDSGGQISGQKLHSYRVRPIRAF